MKMAKSMLFLALVCGLAGCAHIKKHCGQLGCYDGKPIVFVAIGNQ